MENFLKNAGERALDLAVKRNVAAEAFVLHDRELSIEVAGGQVETLKEAEEMGLGLRVINRGRIGFAYTSDLSDQAIEEVVQNAITISNYTAPDEFNLLPDGKYVYPAMPTFDEQIMATTLEQKIDMARELERAARAADQRITLVERAGYDDSEFTSLVMNSQGIYALARGNFCGVYISLVAEEGEDAQNGFAMMAKNRIEDLNVTFTGREAALNAVRSLKARTIPSGNMPCIMEPYVVTRFMGILAQLVDADAVQKGKSMLAGKKNMAVASKVFTLVDDATYQGGIASFPFDGEGVPAQRNTVIENGILRGFLYDNYTAARAGVKSTGNGQRGSFRSLPAVGTTNFMISPGKTSPDKLISEIETGFYITEVMGMHTANPISGDFSVGAAGLMIENGQLTYPVRGVMIAGNLGQFLQDIEAVASDLRFFGSKAAPSIRLKNLSIGGE